MFCNVLPHVILMTIPGGTYVYTVTLERLRLGQEKGDLTGLGQPASIPRIQAWQL